jgi:hypothetical protein
MLQNVCTITGAQIVLVVRNRYEAYHPNIEVYMN